MQVILVVRPCSQTCREDTRYETKESLQEGNFLGYADTIKALHPLSVRC